MCYDKNVPTRGETVSGPFPIFFNSHNLPLSLRHFPAELKKVRRVNSMIALDYASVASGRHHLATVSPDLSVLYSLVGGLPFPAMLFIAPQALNRRVSRISLIDALENYFGNPEATK